MSTALQKKLRRNQRLPRAKNGGVELMLIQTVEHLGKSGDVISVRPGYANNYLLPEGLAIVATEHHKRMIEKHKVKLAELERQKLSKLRALAEDITKQSINVEANANDDGHLYGSVGVPEIIKALKSSGVEGVNDSQIRLPGPLKELGLYTVKVQLHPEIETDLKVWVVPSIG